MCVCEWGEGGGGVSTVVEPRRVYDGLSYSPCKVLLASRVACNLRVIYSEWRGRGGAVRIEPGCNCTAASPVRPVSSRRINHK